MKEQVKNNAPVEGVTQARYWETTIIYNSNLNQKCDIE